MDKRKKIDLIGFIIVAGFALAAFLCYFRGAYQNLPYPANTFLFKPSAAFTDFTGLYGFMAQGNPYEQLNASPYYPLANLVIYLFTRLSLGWSFLVFVLGFLGCLVWFNVRNLGTGDRLELVRNVFIFSFLTYPVLFALDRGNLECLLVLFVLYFAHFFSKERYYLAAFFLSLAIAMKAFPVILSLLFLARRQYRAFIVAGVSTVLVTLASLAVFKCNPVTYVSMVLHGGNIAHDNTFSAFSAANWAFQRGAGLFGVFKLALLNFHVIKLMDMSRWLALYYGVAVSLMGLIAAYVIWIEKKTWKQMALLVFAMLLLPHISSDYRLLYLFVPLLLFINAERSPRRDVVYAVLFGLLLIPKDYFFIPQTETDSLTGDNQNWAPVGISMLLNPILLLTFATLIVAEGFKERAEGKRIHA